MCWTTCSSCRPLPPHPQVREGSKPEEVEEWERKGEGGGEKEGRGMRGARRDAKRRGKVERGSTATKRLKGKGKKRRGNRRC